MQIADVEVRCCRVDGPDIDASRLRGTQYSFEFLVVTLHTDTGHAASCFGFAGRSSRGAGELAAASLRPFLMGRDPMQREQLWHEFRTADRWWNHLPIYSYGPFDTCLWLLGAQDAGQPLYQYLGGYTDRLPTYISSLVHDEPSGYAEEALDVKEKEFHGYKLHTPGRSFEEDIEAHRLVREAVGPDFTLMSDPVAAHNLHDAIRFGKELENLGYYWYEEPLFDEDFEALRRLKAALDIPIVGTEVVAKHPYSVTPYITQGLVDRVRADVSWSGGVTGVLKTAHLAEAFGMNCEVHTGLFHPIELVNLHVAAAIGNTEFFELLSPIEAFEWGLVSPIEIKQGMAILPNGPGLGIGFDWDFIDNCTKEIL